MIVSFNFESTEPEGECSRCHKIIKGKMYVPFIQVGEITDTKSLDINWCEDCFNEVNKTDNTEEN